jgi:hypothetical protein
MPSRIRGVILARSIPRGHRMKYKRVTLKVYSPNHLRGPVGCHQIQTTSTSLHPLKSTPSFRFTDIGTKSAGSAQQPLNESLSIRRSLDPASKRTSARQPQSRKQDRQKTSVDAGIEMRPSTEQFRKASAFRWKRIPFKFTMDSIEIVNQRCPF